jgi:dihydroorotate dehydrogenase electron transfer subunit
MLDRKAKVRKVLDLGGANYLLTLDAPEQAPLVRPGQFIMVKCCEDVEEEPLLRRPFSIFSLTPERRTGPPTGMQILVKDVGEGTRKLVQVRPGQHLYCLGPQGRPFPLAVPSEPNPRFACLVAGGVGIGALYLLARELKASGAAPVLFYGARTQEELVLREYFERLKIDIHYATENGSLGTKGVVTAPLTRFLARHVPDGIRIYACGPWAMMRAAHQLACEYSVPCETSLEARMGCSLGACMGCVVQAAGENAPTRYIRVCVEGPVISSRMVDWDCPPL